MKHTTRTAKARVQALHYRLDVNSLHRDEDAASLALNDLGRISMRTAVPLFVDEYRRNRITGSFILDRRGNVRDGRRGHDPRHARRAWRPTARPAPTWCGTRARCRAPIAGVPRDVHGATVWLTGLSGSGKSTIASALAVRLTEQRVLTYTLDGDNLRHGLNGDLGFSADDRTENVRRVGEVARLFADAGVVALYR